MVSCMGCVSESHIYILSSKSHLLRIYLQLKNVQYKQERDSVKNTDVVPSVLEYYLLSIA